MALTREQRLTKGTTSLENVSLSPEEYFVLSRVEGAPTVGEIVTGSGLARADAERILGKLVEAGVLVPTDAGPKPAPRPSVASGANGSSSIRNRAQERRRRLLRAQLDGRAGSSANEQDAHEGHDDAEEAQDPEWTAPPPMVEADDPRVTSEVPIPTQEQRWILALGDGKDTISPFEFLGIIPTHDDKAIRRGYHETSRKLHPDAYYGKDLGIYREMLADLFRRAKFYYAQLRKQDVRTPYVDAWIEDKARIKREKDAAIAAEEKKDRAARELERKQEEAERAVRREQRAEARARRQRNRLRSRLSEESSTYTAEAEAAEKAGNLAKAANLYRLALRADPGNSDLEARWEGVRDTARTNRARDAFVRAQRYEELGQSAEAAKLYLEAADANPTAEHLAHATEAIVSIDKSQARDFAMAALDALVSEQAKGVAFKPRQVVSMRLMIARGFFAAGLTESAKQQAILARDLRPDDLQVRALLKALKVK